MDEHKKQCRPWQVHLITLVVSMLAAGCILGVNCVPQMVICVDSLGTLNVGRRKEFGWPKTWFFVFEKMGVRAQWEIDPMLVLPNKLVFPKELPIKPVETSSEWDGVPLLVNVIVGCLILLIVGLLSEVVVRRLYRGPRYHRAAL